jgi:hypothetical protein
VAAKEIVKVLLGRHPAHPDPRLPISPTLVRFRPSQKTELGLVIHANSITLTPGTIAVEVEPDEFLVHALTREGAAGLAEQRDGPARAASRGASDVRRRDPGPAGHHRPRPGTRRARPHRVRPPAGANTIGTCAMLLLAVMGFLNGRPEFLDLAWSMACST